MKATDGSDVVGAARRIRSSSSDAATVRADAAQRDPLGGPADEASTAQPRRISDPI